MTDWVHVKDKRTGHEYSVASPDSDVHDVLDKPAADAGGQPLPAKPFVPLGTSVDLNKENI